MEEEEEEERRAMIGDFFQDEGTCEHERERRARDETKQCLEVDNDVV
jgi:hypothetical protein